MVARRAARWLCERRRVPRCNSCSASAVGFFFRAPWFSHRSSFQPALPLPLPLNRLPRSGASAANQQRCQTLGATAAAAHKLTFGSNFSLFFAPAVSLADGKKSLTVAFRHSKRQKSRRKPVLTTRCAEHDTPASPPQHFEAPACAASGGRSTISLAHFHNASSKRICMCHSCFIKVVCFRSKRVVHRPFPVVNHLQRLCPRSHHGAFPRRRPARAAAAHARLESDVCEQVWQCQLALAISVFSQKPVNAESCEG